tara:strand:- start:118 stop:1809 length:1692 start_codon:yes stop_codon:yes gene_type:complete
MGGKGSTTIQAPDPVNPADAQGEFLFGQGFKGFQGVTDPILQQRLLGAEATFRPQYTALELADIGTFARGTKERANPEYQRIQSRIKALKKGDAATKGAISEKKLREKAKKLYPVPKKGFRESKKTRQKREQQQRLQDDYVQQGLKGVSGQNAAEIAELEAQLASTPKRLGKTRGLFDLLEESSQRAFDLQSQQLGQQRAADVAALQNFARPVVEAYRAADKESTGLAELATARAGRETGLGARGQGLLGSRVRSASAAERQLQEMGMTLGDLSPTEQEALISGRGTEFIQSTGELTPLEQRRVQQSARQASLARGRELGQGALAQEIANRFAEESGKREREIALGSQLLGQEASLRGARLGQGAGMLTQSEALAAQRRAEQLQRMQLGAGFIGQEEGIQSGRFGQAFGMNRALAGDAGNIILGRPSAAIGLGQQTLGQAQAGAAGQMGPQLFDPNVGINFAMQNQANQFGLLGAQAQADASRSAGFMGAAGTIGAALICWVAREVYGAQNPQWIQFRNWMLNDSPSWFLNLYIKYGERFAKFISNKPVLKNIIRKWMNTKIK